MTANACFLFRSYGNSLSLRHAFCVAAILLVLLPIAGRAGNIQISVAPTARAGFGATEYRLKGGVLTESAGIVSLESKLEFPVDLQQVGVEFELLKPGPRAPDWAVRARLMISVSDPGSKLLDHDWIDGLKFSFTESRTEGSVTLLEATVRKSILRDRGADLALLAGIRYQKISQKAIGIEGWQINPFDPSSIPIPVSDNRLGLTYDISYKMPLLGLMPSIQIGSKMSIAGKIAVSRLFVSDVDDHVLRKKISEADGPGTGLISALTLRRVLREMRGRNLFVQIGGEFVTLTADISQKQTWYGNDPADDFFDPGTGELVINDNTGDVLTGIEHVIRSTQYNIGLQVGFVFH